MWVVQSQILWLLAGWSSAGMPAAWAGQSCLSVHCFLPCCSPPPLLHPASKQQHQQPCRSSRALPTRSARQQVRSTCSKTSQGAPAGAQGMLLPPGSPCAAARPLGATAPAAAHLPPPALVPAGRSSSCLPLHADPALPRATCRKQQPAAAGAGADWADHRPSARGQDRRCGTRVR